MLNTGAPVLMTRWIDHVPALIEAWYPGQEGSTAIADILFGEVNPSGRLPVTFLREWKNSPAYPTYPGKNGMTHYSEGVFVGYRHFDRHNIEPLFPFGYGLSYTTFAYSDLALTVKKALPDPEIEVALTLENTGKREGKEVVQLYVRDVVASVERPTKELKGFQIVALKSGEKTRVTLKLDKSSFAFFDPSTNGWVVEPGQFEVMIGSSSKDIRLRSTLDFK